MPDNKKLESKLKHQKEVQEIVGMIIDAARSQSKTHDSDKIQLIRDGVECEDERKCDTDHKMQSPHHHFTFQPDKMTIVDFIEHIADMISASREFGGEIMLPYHQSILDSEVMRTFVENSVKLFEPKARIIFQTYEEHLIASGKVNPDEQDSPELTNPPEPEDDQRPKELNPEQLITDEMIEEAK